MCKKLVSLRDDQTANARVSECPKMGISKCPRMKKCFSSVAGEFDSLLKLVLRLHEFSPRSFAAKARWQLVV